MEQIATHKLIKEIESHPELHDLITHLGDFDSACEMALNSTKDPDEKLYWERQLRTTRKLIEIVNSKP